MAEPCVCSITISLPAMQGSIFVFYGLTQFYQNHRKYGWSRDDPQLNGKNVNQENQVSDCMPYNGIYNNDTGAWEKNYAPCGLIANSLFNDTFNLTAQDGVDIPVTRSGIAWPSDVKTKFQNPVYENCNHNDKTCKNNLTAAFAPYATPSWWPTSVNEIGANDDEGHGYKNEALMVWMQVAAFPTFQKKYGRLDNNTLHPGTYNLTIAYNYPVTYSFNTGRKYFIISTSGWMGRKNLFMGVTYIV